ncbi:MAG: hypothetical protein JWQ66_193 [Mucilaginibacter sp.]|jgi:hypothetical protein|nr:hypothetical protein [Mucilaginibacter sp.]
MIFIRFLLIAILVIYIIRSLVRILLPMLFQSLVNKAQQQNQQQYRSQKAPEGKIKVDYMPNTKSSIPDSEGDFVDYEEIK